LLERVVEVSFDSRFTQNIEDVDESLNIYIANQKVSEKEWKIQHRYALFAMLIPHSVEYYKEKEFLNPFIPAEIKELSKKYVYGSDDVYTWFKNTWKYTGNDTDIITMQSALAEFKATDTFKTLDREEKKQINREFIKSSLDNEVKLSKVFHERFQRTNSAGKRVETKNCWLGWKIESEDSIEETDCD